MDAKKFFSIFREGMNDFYRNPVVIIPGLILWIVSVVMARVAGRVGQTSLPASLAYGWLVVSILILLTIFSFIFAGLIGMSGDVVRKKKKNFFNHAGRFWVKNLLIVSLIIIVSVLIGRAAHYGGIFIGGIFNLSLGAAQFVFLLIYFIGLIGVLIWFTFSSFFLVYEGKNVRESIRKSFSFVKKDYLGVLSLLVVFFVVFYLLGKVSGVVGAGLEYLVLLPYFALVLSRFVLK